MFSQTTHATLLARVSAGHDSAAWQEFCDRYGALIRGFARLRGLQPADCDDVVQETLLALTKSMSQFRYDPAKGKFRAYLKTIVLRTIYRRSRQKGRETSLEEVEAAVAQAAANSDTDAQWEAQWRQYHLRLAMQTIGAEFGEKDRAAFDAYAVHGRDARETAESQGLSVDQVYQAKSRILKRLGELIEQQAKEEG